MVYNDYKFLKQFFGPTDNCIIENCLIGTEEYFYFTTDTRLYKYSLSSGKIKLVDIDSDTGNTPNEFKVFNKYLLKYDGKLLLVHNHEYKIELFDFNLVSIESVKDDSFKHPPMGEMEKLKFGQLIKNDKDFSIFQNSVIFGDYLILYFKPRERFNYRHKIDIWNLKNKEKVFSGFNEKFSFLTMQKAI